MNFDGREINWGMETHPDGTKKVVLVTKVGLRLVRLSNKEELQKFANALYNAGEMAGFFAE